MVLKTREHTLKSIKTRRHFRGKNTSVLKEWQSTGVRFFCVPLFNYWGRLSVANNSSSKHLNPLIKKLEQYVK